MAEEDPERREEALPAGGAHILVVVVAVQQQGGVERDAEQPLLGERALVQANALGHVLVLLVEHEREKVVPSLRLSLPDSSMNRLSSRNSPPKTKKAGGNVPGTWKPSYRITIFFMPSKFLHDKKALLWAIAFCSTKSFDSRHYQNPLP